MPQSTEVSGIDTLTDKRWNDLRKDILDPSLGHKHTGETDAGYLINQADVIANRPAFGNRGVLFFATDEKILYRDTGTAWEKVGVVDAADLDGRATMAQMPDGTSGYVLTAQGAGVNPVYAAPPAPGATTEQLALIYASL